MNNGYCTFTNLNGGHWFILQTDKRKFTYRMMAEMLKQIAAAYGKSEDSIAEVMQNKAAAAEFRKRVELLRFEERECEVHIEVGNLDRPHTIGNYEADRMTIFAEPPKENLRLKRFLEEV